MAGAAWAGTRRSGSSRRRGGWRPSSAPSSTSTPRCRLWDGSRTPLGSNVTGPFEIRIAGPGVIGSLLRRPTLDNFIRHYVDKGIDFAGGTLIDLGSQLNRGGRSVKLKGRDALALAAKLSPFILARGDAARRRPGL